jgi:indole-3-glycerol phosphate synthase/phosphoribosylanthranilate isomerase
MSRLQDLVVRKRAEIEHRRRLHPEADLRRAAEPTSRRFGDALRRPGLRFILECKRASPSEGLLRPDYDPGALVEAFAGVADAVSVLTDGAWFRGSLAHLAAVRARTALPILCKDFILDPWQVLEARCHGADAVLLILSLLDDAAYRRSAAAAAALGMDVLSEVHDEYELERALRLDAPIIGINNRDLRTLAVDHGTTARLASRIPRDRLIVCESGIRSRADVDAVAGVTRVFLVGTRMMRSPRVDLAARELAFGAVKVCGLTSVAAARAAHAAGATLGGVVFAPDSPRRVDVRGAEAIAAGPLPLAGVFVNAALGTVLEIAARVGLAAVQLHGDEPRDYLAALRSRLPAACEIWKAVYGDGVVPTAGEVGADPLVVDSRVPGRRGGTGRSFDWSVLRHHPDLGRLVLAGGLDAGNVRAAHAVGCGMLDVSSGVESAPGVKDPARLDQFFGALRGAA